MKKILILSWALTCFLPWAAAQSGTVSLHFNLGILSNSTGEIPVQDGSLFLVIGSANNTFFAPTPTDFLGGNANEVILWQGGFNHSSSGVFGAMGLALDSFSIPYGSINTGSAIDIFWFPSLLASATAPGITQYGSYGFSTGAATWVIPPGGSTVDLSFLTVSAIGAGGNPDSMGFANLTTSAVPEPATYAVLAGIVALGFAVWRRRAVRAS